MLKKIVTALALTTVCAQAQLTVGGRTFSDEQVENFKLAYAYGKMIGHEKELMGVLNTESDATPINVGDKSLKAFQRSYGVMQVKLGTYYWTKKKGYIMPLDEKHSLTEEEVLFHLMKNNNFNIYVAAGYFKLMKDLCGSVDKAISGYNRGHCKEVDKGIAYRNKVKKFMDFMEKHDFVNKIAMLINADENDYTVEAEKNFNAPSEEEASNPHSSVYQNKNLATKPTKKDPASKKSAEPKVYKSANEQNLAKNSVKNGNSTKQALDSSSIKNGRLGANSSYESTYYTNFIKTK
jgi:hypothetical protein